MGNDIENDIERAELPDHQRRAADELVRQQVGRLYGLDQSQRLEMRRAATSSYNCHGMTFANRRTCIRESHTVIGILDDDGYAVVGDDDIRPGDIAVYLRDGEVIHTGVVVRIDSTRFGRVPYVLSKWGKAGEYIHRAEVYPQHHDRVVYHREAQR